MASVSRRPLHVFRRSGVHNALESRWWVEEVFGKLSRPVILHALDEPLVSDSLVMGSGILCFQCRGDEPDGSAAGVLDEVERRCLHNVGFMEYGDEQGDSPSLNLYPNFPFVLRNYHFRRLPQNYVWIPNGPRTGVQPMGASSLLLASRRPVLCSWSGSLGLAGWEKYAARRAMFAALPKGMCDIRGNEETKFGGPESPWEYSLLLRRSRFTLNPRGSSNETMRLYDAWSAGSIPVMLRGADFLDLIPDAPIVFLDSWDDLAGALESVDADEMQAQGLSFIEDLPKRVAKQVDVVLDRAFGD